MFTPVSEETFQDGQVIYQEGTSGDWVYIIISGSVEISRMVNGRRYVLAVLKEGEIFGELSFLGKVKRTASTTAVGETTIGIIDRAFLDDEYNKLSSDFRALLMAVVKRFENMIERASDFSIRSEPRVSKVLSLSFKDRQSFINSYTTNISQGGLFLKSNTPLKQGELFQLNLQLPDLEQPIRIQSKVAWAREPSVASEKSPAGMGIRFIEIEKADSLILKNYVEKIMKELS